MNLRFARGLGLLAVGLLLGGSRPAQAAPIFFQSGSANDLPGTTIKLALPAFTPIGTDYSGLGVTFSPGVPDDPSAGILGTPAGTFSPISISFSTAQDGATLALIGNPLEPGPSGSTRFEALLGGVVQASGAGWTGTSSGTAFVGFTGGAFDQIRISVGPSTNNGGRSSEISVGPSTNVGGRSSESPGGPAPQANPEPGTMALFGLGALGLLAYARRKRDRAG
jgi:PEP-CTERM motif-containing protein